MNYIAPSAMIGGNCYFSVFGCDVPCDLVCTILMFLFFFLFSLSSLVKILFV